MADQAVSLLAKLLTNRASVPFTELFQEMLLNAPKEVLNFFSSFSIIEQAQFFRSHQDHFQMCNGYVSLISTGKEIAPNSLDEKERKAQKRFLTGTAHVLVCLRKMCNVLSDDYESVGHCVLFILKDILENTDLNSSEKQLALYESVPYFQFVNSKFIAFVDREYVESNAITYEERTLLFFASYINWSGRTHYKKLVELLKNINVKAYDSCLFNSTEMQRHYFDQRYEYFEVNDAGDVRFASSYYWSQKSCASVDDSITVEAGHKNICAIASKASDNGKFLSISKSVVEKTNVTDTDFKENNLIDNLQLLSLKEQPTHVADAGNIKGTEQNLDLVSERIVEGIAFLLKYFKLEPDSALLNTVLHVLSDVKMIFLKLSSSDVCLIYKLVFCNFSFDGSTLSVSTLIVNRLSEKEQDDLFLVYLMRDESIVHCDELLKFYQLYNRKAPRCIESGESKYLSPESEVYYMTSDGYITLQTIPRIDCKQSLSEYCCSRKFELPQPRDTNADRNAQFHNLPITTNNQASGFIQSCMHIPNKQNTALPEVVVCGPEQLISSNNLFSSSCQKVTDAIKFASGYLHLNIFDSNVHHIMQHLFSIALHILEDTKYYFFTLSTSQQYEMVYSIFNNFRIENYKLFCSLAAPILCSLSEADKEHLFIAVIVSKSGQMHYRQIFMSFIYYGMPLPHLADSDQTQFWYFSSKGRLFSISDDGYVQVFLPQIDWNSIFDHIRFASANSSLSNDSVPAFHQQSQLQYISMVNYNQQSQLQYIPIVSNNQQRAIASYNQQPQLQYVPTVINNPSAYVLSVQPFNVPCPPKNQQYIDPNNYFAPVYNASLDTHHPVADYSSGACNVVAQSRPEVKKLPNDSLEGNIFPAGHKIHTMPFKAADINYHSSMMNDRQLFSNISSAEGEELSSSSTGAYNTLGRCNTIVNVLTEDFVQKFHIKDKSHQVFLKEDTFNDTLGSKTRKIDSLQTVPSKNQEYCGTINASEQLAFSFDEVVNTNSNSQNFTPNESVIDVSSTSSPNMSNFGYNRPLYISQSTNKTILHDEVTQQYATVLDEKLQIDSIPKSVESNEILDNYVVHLPTRNTTLDSKSIHPRVQPTEVENYFSVSNQIPSTPNKVGTHLASQNSAHKIKSLDGTETASFSSHLYQIETPSETEISASINDRLGTDDPFNKNPSDFYVPHADEDAKFLELMGSYFDSCNLEEENAKSAAEKIKNNVDPISTLSSESSQLYDESDLKAVDFFSSVLSIYDKGLPIRALEDKTAFASKQIREHLKQAYNNNLFSFFSAHDVFFVDYFSAMVYLAKAQLKKIWT